MTTTIFDATTAGYDTFALAGEPGRPHNRLPYAVLQEDAAIYYLWWDLLRLPADASIDSAVLHGYTGGDWTGSVELSASHVDDSWDAGALTWDNRPGIVGTPVDVTHSPSGVGVEYAFDVAPIVSAVLHAGVFNGFAVRRIGAGDPVRVFQRDSSSEFTWWLEVEWTGKGSKPSRLQPNGVVGLPAPLLFGFPKDAVACRVHADPDEHGFGSPAFDSLSQPISAPEYDLDLDPGWPGTITDGAWWWIVACQNKAGDWGDYSDPIRFTYRPMPTLTLTSPDPANPFVTDSSFPITWDFEGTQKAHHVWITATDGQGTIVWDNKKQASADRSVTVPRGTLKSKEADAYRVWLEVFPDDATERVAEPGAQVFARVAQVFTYAPVPGVPGFDSIGVTQPDDGPWVFIHVDRAAGAPDQLQLWRNNELILDGIDPTDVDDRVNGGWTIVDATAPMGRECDYFVAPVVNGQSGSTGPHAVYVPAAAGLWLHDYSDDRQLRVRVLNEDPEALLTATAEDQASTTWAVGARFPDTITSAVGFPRGNIDGFLSDDLFWPDLGRAATDHLDDLLAMKLTPSRAVRLTYQIWSCLVTIHDVIPLPYASHATWQRVQMRYEQVGPWSRTVPLGDGEALFPDPDHIWTYGGGTNGHVVTVGEYDIDAIGGTLALDSAGVIPGHTATMGIGHGSFTRSIDSVNSFTDDAYFTIPAGMSASSLFTIKNPGVAGTPLDCRLRSAGTIDLKAEDGSVPDTADFTWTAGMRGRRTIRCHYDPVSGILAGAVDLYVRDNGEQYVPDDTLFFSIVADGPVNLACGNPGGGPIFEVERYWNTELIAPPYGTPPSSEELAPGVALWAGDVRQTTVEIAAFTGSYDDGTGTLIPVTPTDLVGLRLSTHADMSSSFSGGTAAVHSATGWQKWSASGLTVGIAYYHQLTINGTARGPIGKFWTLQAAGTACDVNLAIFGCKQDNPASTAVAADIVAWGVSHLRAIDLGDFGYPGDLSPTSPDRHEASWALNVTDPAVILVSSVCSREYGWSDHDANGDASTSGNNPNKDDPTTAQGLIGWARSVPALMMDTRAPKRCNYRSYVEGKWRFIRYDHRSLDRDDVRENGVAPTADTSLLGPWQRTQLETDFAAAATAGEFVVILGDTALNGVSPFVPGLGIPATYSDKWASYVTERAWWIGRLAALCGTTTWGGVTHPNGIYAGSDTHLLELEDGTGTHVDPDTGLTVPNAVAGMVSAVAGPFHQQLHAHYQLWYQQNYPAGIDEGGGPYRKAMQYIRAALTNPSAKHFRVVLQPRDCSTKVSGTPKDVMTALDETWILP